MKTMRQKVKALALCAVCAWGVSPALGETYTLAGKDSAGSTSLAGSGAGWKNESGTVVKHTPTAGNTYIVDNGYEMRTPQGGGALTVNGEFFFRTCQLRFKLNHQSTTTFADAHVDSGVCEFIPGDIGNRYFVAGNIEIGPDGTLQLDSQRTTAGDYRTFNLKGTLTGSGTLHCKIIEGKLGGEEPIYIDGNLSGFTGRIWLENPYTDSTYPYVMEFTTSASAPGAMTEPTSDGFVLENEVTAKFDYSTTFDGNRGFVFGKQANGRTPTIYVAADQEVVIFGPVSGVQGFNKTGPGKLSVKTASDGLSGTITVSEGTLAYVSFPNATVLTTGSGTTEPIDPSAKFIRVSAVDYNGYEDDESHGITVTIMNPEAGVDYAKEWSEDGATFGPTEPRYQQAGTHKVWCRISADGYESVTASADVKISLRTIVASMTASTAEPCLGGTHAVPAYSIKEPAEGYTLAWTVNGSAKGATEPVFTAPGYYEISCTVSAPHYATKTISGTLSWRCRGTVYVDASKGDGTPPYDTPEKATSDLLAAIMMTDDGSEIRVASGEYELPEGVQIGRGLKVVGPADRSAVVKGAHGIRMKDDNSQSRLLTGFTFEGLREPAVGIKPYTVVSNCLFRGCANPVSLEGGDLVDSEIVGFSGYCAVCVTSGQMLRRILRTRIVGGDLNAGYDANVLSAPIILPGTVTLQMEDCEVSNCTNLMKGATAGVLDYGPEAGVSVSASRCRFVGNLGRHAFCRGGNGKSSGNVTTLKNCLIAGNRSVNATRGSHTAASAKVLVWAKGEFVNCTFADNTCEDAAVGGLFEVINSKQEDETSLHVVLKNCICSGNGVPTVPSGRSLPQMSHTIYPECGANDADGNLPGPARFVGHGRDAYRLSSNSPGLGAGDILDWTKDDVDLIGNRRVRNEKIDMGCYQGGVGLIIFVQ